MLLDKAELLEKYYTRGNPIAFQGEYLVYWIYRRCAAFASRRTTGPPRT